MAVPQTISSQGPALFAGPFVYNGAVYVVAKDTGATPGEIAVWKADTPASASFAKQDSASQPTATTASAFAAITAEAKNTVILVASFDAVLAEYEFHEFDMATDTWAAINETIVATVALDGPGGAYVSIALRWNGEVVVQYQGDSDKSHGTEYARNEWARRTNLSVWSSGNAIGSPVANATDWFAGTAILGGDGDRVHFFYNEQTSDDLLSKTLDSADSLSSVLSIDTVIDAAVRSHSGTRGVAYDDDGTVRVFCFYMNDDGDLWEATYTSADSPTSPTLREVTANVIISGDPGYWCGAVYRKQLWVSFGKVTTGDLVRISSEDVAAYTGETTTEVGSFGDHSCNVIDYGDGPKLATLVSSGSDLRYNEHDIAPTALDWDVDAVFPEQNYNLGPFGT